MLLVDSHCHIDFEPLGEDIPGVLERASNNNVAYMLCVSVNLEDYPRVLSLAVSHDNVFASVGVHPNEQDGHDPSVVELIELGSNANVVAIGETGLDYFRTEPGAKWQTDRFENHIEAANTLQKPLIIHTRDAADDTIAVMRTSNAQDAGGVMHCFAQDWPFAKQCLDLGFYISFSGIVTFKNAQAIKEVAQKAPIDRILIETDSPYLAPVPFRGKTNEPSYVLHTAEHLAELRNQTLEDLAEHTTHNFFTLFNNATQ